MNCLRFGLLPALLLAGCPDPVAPDGGPNGLDAAMAPVVELGTGQSDWEDLPDTGARTELIYGAQGGYHVWGRARFRGFAPDVDIWFSAVRVDDGQMLHSPQPARRWIAEGVRRGLLDLGNGRYATDAELVVLGIMCSNEVVGRTLRITLTVHERATGREATATRDVTVIDEVPSPACAMPTG